MFQKATSMTTDADIKLCCWTSQRQFVHLWHLPTDIPFFKQKDLPRDRFARYSVRNPLWYNLINDGRPPDIPLTQLGSPILTWARAGRLVSSSLANVPLPQSKVQAAYWGCLDPCLLNSKHKCKQAEMAQIGAALPRVGSGIMTGSRLLPLPPCP